MESKGVCSTCFKRLVYPLCSLVGLSWDKEHPESLPPECSSHEKQPLTTPTKQYQNIAKATSDI